MRIEVQNEASFQCNQESQVREVWRPFGMFLSCLPWFSNLREESQILARKRSPWRPSAKDPLRGIRPCRKKVAVMASTNALIGQAIGFLGAIQRAAGVLEKPMLRLWHRRVQLWQLSAFASSRLERWASIRREKTFSLIWLRGSLHFRKPEFQLMSLTAIKAL